MPDVNKKTEKVFAFVDHVGSIDDVVSVLRDTEYTTKARVKRKQAGARLVARGVYLLANHKEPKSKETFNNHVHLAYVRKALTKFCSVSGVTLDLGTDTS